MRGGPSNLGTLLSLQPGAPSVLEQGPERRNCHTSRVQLVSAGWSCPGAVLAVPAQAVHSVGFFLGGVNPSSANICVQLSPLPLLSWGGGGGVCVCPCTLCHLCPCC